VIAIIDYGMGNLASVYKALIHIGQDSIITSDAKVISSADAVILPGVGAMGDAMKNLIDTGLHDAIIEFIDSGKPFLGICLGMQMLFDSSNEGEEHDGQKVKGLGVIKGQVLRLPNMQSIKVPHMGWNQLSETSDSILPEGRNVYFVHSYYVQPEDSSVITSKSIHGIEFTASIRQENVCAMQFHPEKSGDTGLQILRDWVREG
jgi:glutamine amidotransferase